jgi:hypothetical protein
LFLFILAGCSKKDSDVLGVWSTGSEKITFLDDGTVLVEGNQNPIQLTWRRLDDNRLMLTGTGFGQVTLLGCVASGMIKLRVRDPMRGTEGIATYYRTRSDGTLVMTRTSVSGPFGGGSALDCTP